MADLLECLVQIKALAETVPRLEALVARGPAVPEGAAPGSGDAAPGAEVAHLAAREADFLDQIRRWLAASSPRTVLGEAPDPPVRLSGSGVPLGDALAAFAARRAETLRVLAACNAEQLGRTAIHPVRGEVTVADLVATLLAHDTDHLGQIRRHLRFAIQPDGREGAQR